MKVKTDNRHWRKGGYESPLEGLGIGVWEVGKHTVKFVSNTPTVQTGGSPLVCA
jgi:hypothetical protein